MLTTENEKTWFFSKTFCSCEVIFKIKKKWGISEDLHSDPLLLVPTYIMTKDLENHKNVKNKKTSTSQEQNTTFYDIKKFLTCISDDKFWELIIS